MFFNVTVICFSFFVSCLFDKGKIAALMASLLWGLSFIPFTILHSEESYIDELDFSSNFFWSLLPGTGIGFAILSISALEVHEGGLHFSTLFLKSHEDGLSVGLLILAFIMSSLILIALLVNIEMIVADKTKKRKWWNLVKVFWRWLTKQNCIQDGIKIEDIGANAIKVENLTKIFKRKIADIDDVSFEVAANQITVLLESSGNAKSTIFSLMKGEYSPTFGDIKFFEAYHQSLLGISAKNNELLRDLTTLDQLLFTCSIRGVSETEALKQSREYLDLFNLFLQRNTPMKYLSPELLQKVSLANSLCGHPNIVFLYEPTIGLDLSSKEQIWEVLKKEKKSKTIFIVTNCVTEAEHLADEIVLLRDGKVHLSGSPSFINKKLGLGYRLICAKNEICFSENITGLLKKFIPEIEVYDESESRVIYNLDEIHLPVFSEILKILDSDSKRLGIDDLKLYEMSLNDFLAR